MHHGMPAVSIERTDAAGAEPVVLRTDIAAFIGLAERGPLDTPVAVESWRQFQAHFGRPFGSGYLAWAVRKPLANPNGFTPESERIPEWAQLAAFPGTKIHLGVLVAVLAVPAVWWLMRSTRFGFASQVVGESPTVAAANGIDVARTVITASLISGALGGIAGAIMLLGSEFRLSLAISSGIGFTAIVVALLRPSGARVADANRLLVATTDFLAAGGDRIFDPVRPPTGFAIVRDAYDAAVAADQIPEEVREEVEYEEVAIYGPTKK